jgi:hypothetical protein
VKKPVLNMNLGQGSVEEVSKFFFNVMNWKEE